MAKNLTETATFDANVSAPENGDYATEALFEAGLQSLANRSQYLLDVLEGDQDLAVTGVPFIIDPRDFLTRYSATDYWDYQGNDSLISLVNSGAVELSLRKHLPAGAIITGIDVIMTPGASLSSRGGAGTGMRVRLHETTFDFATPAGNSNALIGTVEQGEAAAVQTVSFTNGSAPGNLPKTFDPTKSLYLEVIAGNDGGSLQDILWAIRVTMTYPGPRNF